MKKDNIKSGLIKDRKYLLPLNKVVSDNRALAVISLLLTVTLVLLINYVFNCIFQLPNLMKDISNPALYFGIKNMFVFNFKKYWWFYLILVVLMMYVNVRLWYLVKVNIKDQNVGQKGDDRFTTIEEIQEQYPSMPLKGGPIEGKGGVPVCQYKGDVYFDDTDVNNMIIGMTRSGKGEQILLLMLWIYCNAKKKTSVIYNDPKLEVVTATAKRFEKAGYDTWVLNLVNPYDGIGFDPVELVKQEWRAGKQSSAERVALSVAEMIYHPSRIEGEAKFWASSSASLFSAMIIAQVIDCTAADEKINAKNLLEWKKKQKAFEKLSDEEKEKARAAAKKEKNKLVLPFIPPEFEYVLTHENEDKINIYSACKMFMDLASVQIGDTDKTALDVFFEERPDGDRAKMKFFTTKIAADRTKASIYASMFDQLTIFTYEEFAKMTAKSTVNLRDIGFGEKPVIVYLCTPDWDTSAHFIASIFITQIYYVLSETAATRPNKRCDRDVQIIIDEVGEFPEILNMSNMISMGTGKGVLFTLALQSYSQLENYQEKVAKTIKQNCGNQIYILSEDKDTREKFSADIGTETVTNVHRTGEYLELHKNMMEVYEDRPLINANQLSNLAEGENVIVRYVKRRDNNGDKIRAHPIFNTGPTAFQYRYEYLLDEFPGDIPFSALTIHHRCKTDFNLTDICVDTDKIFEEKMSRLAAEKKGTDFYAENETPETMRQIKDLKRADMVLKQLRSFVLTQNCETMTVAEAINELNNAESLHLITKAEKEGILDLIMS